MRNSWARGFAVLQSTLPAGVEMGQGQKFNMGLAIVRAKGKATLPLGSGVPFSRTQEVLRGPAVVSGRDFC